MVPLTDWIKPESNIHNRSKKNTDLFRVWDPVDLRPDPVFFHPDLVQISDTDPKKDLQPILIQYKAIHRVLEFLIFVIFRLLVFVTQKYIY